MFGRGGLHSVTGDTPQRKGLHGLKGANDKTKHPCSLCRVTQSQAEENIGGELGERGYDILRHRRTRGQVEESRRKLTAAGLGTNAAANMSRDLGVLEPDGLNQPRILFDSCSTHNPMLVCGPELLHLDYLVRESESKQHMNDSNTGDVPTQHAHANVGRKVRRCQSLGMIIVLYGA